MSILMIGLGGGTFSSHIAWKYPKVNLTIVELSPLITKLAVDWFGIKDDERHRVIVNDGAEYLKEALYRGERFDAILLDATYSNRNNYITAPVKEFLDEDVIKNMGLLLGEDGILVSNVVFGELKEVDEAKGMQFIIDLFGTEFSHTEIYTIYGPGFNYVLLARQKPMKNISSMIQLQKYGPY
ncbi:hypothetical protein WR25_00373 isoform I [Diploscapter pachys]|nr:hypothetical protein WR25_00373 isoform G [Diploscapter pachys]PAV66872.1 hypothetical protein WR25_00373 isoform I [Diploscapter pachys]